MSVMLASILLLLFVDVKGHMSGGIKLISDQSQTILKGNSNKISPWWWQLRVKRNSPNDFNSTRDAYEKAVNESIEDYYAQRKAVMDRYYARQRQIAESFRNQSVTWRPSNLQPIDRSVNQSERVPTVTTLQPLELEQHPRVIEARSVGYQRLGNCSHLDEVKLLYQHNLGIGLKGPSQLDTNFQVNLDGPISITCVEALPYNNSQGNVSWLSGGPGYNFVKLNLKALENKGISYTIKVYGVDST